MEGMIEQNQGAKQSGSENSCSTPCSDKLLSLSNSVYTCKSILERYYHRTAGFVLAACP